MTAPPDARRLQARALRSIRRSGSLHEGDHVLAAVSGGPDSSALLLLLAALRRPLHLDLRAAWFDHRLRGRAAAEQERQAVERLAALAGVPLAGGGEDVRSLARAQRRSLEDAARRARYRFLAATAADHGCTVVATGHTLDDQAETVLLHLLRGSGLAGLAGMAPRSPWPFGAGPALARPLLDLRRDHLSVYCHLRGWEPVLDASNLSPAFARNRIRQEVLPVLRGINPRLEEALARLAASVRGDLAVLESLAVAPLEGRPEEGRVHLRSDRLRALPLPLRRHAARLALARLAPDAAPGEAQIEALARAAELGPGSSLDLPGGLRAYAGYDDVELAHEAAAEPFPGDPVPLAIPGITPVQGWRFETALLPSAPRDIPPDAIVLDADAVPEPEVRRRRPGDRFRPSGMDGEKKLQDFLVDARVPRRERDLLPLLLSGGRIAAVGTLRTAQWARPGAGTRSFLLLREARQD